MARDAKPATAKQAGTKPAAAGVAEAPPKKSKKMLIIIIAAIVLLIGGVATAFLLLQPPAHPAKKDAAAAEGAENEAHAKTPPKFVDIGTFTANLMHEDDNDRYLQVGISLKITKPELEEKIKASNPEILHRVNMVLQSKRPSDLATIEGKDKLSQQIRGQVEYVLGLRKTAPSLSVEQAETTPTGTPNIKSDIAEVLFTSFIIQ
jgi:flagellar FliL protein